MHACVVGWGEASAASGNSSARRALELSSASSLKPYRLSSKKGDVKKTSTRVHDQRESSNQYYPAVVSVLLQVLDASEINYVLHTC